MRKAPWLLAAMVLLAAASTLATAESPTLLIRVERESSADLEKLLREGIPVIHESTASLFVEGDHQDLARLRERGYRAGTLDENPWAWDYLQIGLRPDTRLEQLREHGRVVHEEANWILLRVSRGHRDAELYEARGLIAVLPHEPLDLPVSPAGSPKAPEESREGADGPDPLIQQMVDGVDTARVDTYWSDLVENPPTGTRFSTSSGCDDAAEYCRNEMLAAGVDAEFQSYSGNHAPNVVGERTGALTPEQVYIVIGHLDDMPMWGPAPGANDNASGSVTVLEAARSMSCYAFESTVKYITCTGEELGLLGSDAYAADAKARGEDIRGVLNFDMNGWEGDGLPSQENLDLSYNAASEELALVFEQAAEDYQTGLQVNAFLCPDMTASDHYSFWKRGYDALCGITDNEGYCGQEGHYPYYHTSSDTIANCGDSSFFYSTVKAAVATLATLAKPFRITFAADSTVAGEPIGLLVGDRDLDLDPSAVESVEVEVWSTTEPTPEIVSLTERGQSDMVFEGEAPTTDAPPEEGDGVVSVVEGDTLSARYVDALDCDGAADVPYVDEAGVDGISIPGEVHGLTVTKQPSTRLSWDEVPDASRYDVAGGWLADLTNDGDVSDAMCLEDDHPDTEWDDTRDDPGPSAGYYYIVRGQNAEGAGGYGAGTDGTERQPGACP